MSYATLAELKSVMDIPDTADDGDLQRALNAASSQIERYCGRVFALDTADKTKVYEAIGDGVLEVVDLNTITSIKLDTSGDRTYATTLATTDYELRPYTGPPYQEVRSWPLSSRWFGPGRLAQIVGKFGYAENGVAPVPVNLACLILAERYFKRHEAPFGVLQSTDLGQYTRISTNDPDVVNLLAPYVRAKAWAVV